MFIGLIVQSKQADFMKKIVLLLMMVSFFSTELNAQQTPATQLANRIANKMKDTLNLTGNQRNQIYLFNMLLHNQKTAVRQQYSNPDSVRVHLQRVENKRDSLYHTILSENKYLLYKQKKRNLITGN